jgi:outer membrane receptor protein involved in Fe transport
VASLVTGRQLAGAPFVQSQWNVTDRLRVDVGARYDLLASRAAPDGGEALSATHGVLSPKLGTFLRLSPIVGLYGNLSRGFRSPDGVISDPSLTPITAWAYEGGVKVDRDGASASAALFRMDVSNEQTFNPITLESSSGGASRRQGLELDWRTPLLTRDVILSGEWTFNDARYRSLTSVPEDGEGPPVVLNGFRVFNTSKYVGVAAIELAPAKHAWRARVAGNWVGPYSPFDEAGAVVGGYGLAHISAGWNVRNLEADIGLRNLFNRDYPELIAGSVVAPGEPRTVFVSLRARP